MMLGKRLKAAALVFALFGVGCAVKKNDADDFKALFEQHEVGSSMVPGLGPIEVGDILQHKSFGPATIKRLFYDPESGLTAGTFLFAPASKDQNHTVFLIDQENFAKRGGGSAKERK